VGDFSELSTYLLQIKDTTCDLSILSDLFSLIDGSELLRNFSDIYVLMAGNSNGIELTERQAKVLSTYSCVIIGYMLVDSDHHLTESKSLVN